MIDVSSVLLWAVVTFASYYLLKQVYIRLFLSFDDDVVTIVGTPFVDRPPIDKITKMHLLDAENVQKHGPVIRFVNSIKPWDVTLLISEPNLIRELFVGVDWKLWERAHYTGESHAAYTKGIISASNGELWRDTVSDRQLSPLNDPSKLISCPFSSSVLFLKEPSILLLCANIRLCSWISGLCSLSSWKRPTMKTHKDLTFSLASTGLP